MNIGGSPIESPPSPHGNDFAEQPAVAAFDEINWAFLFFSCVILIGFMLAPGLHDLQAANTVFPLFMHWILESTTTIIAGLIFVGCFWQSGALNGNRLFLASGLLLAGGMDFLHEVRYAHSHQESILFWLSARVTEVSSLLAVIAVDWPTPLRRATPLAWLGLAVMGCLGVICLIFFNPEFWPSMFEAGKGLTDAKIYTEYAIITMLMVSLVISILRNDNISFFNRSNIQTAIFCSIFCSLCFTIYPNFGSMYSFLGHIYKALAYYFFLKAFNVPGMPDWFRALVAKIGGLSPKQPR